MAKNTENDIKAEIKEEADRLTALSRTLRKHTVLRNALIDHYDSSGDTKTTSEIIRTMVRYLRIDIFWITDTQKKIIYQTHSKKQGDIKDIDPVNHALAGKNSIYMSKGSLGWSIRSYGPIEHYGKVIGTVMVGTWVNHALAKRIAHAINANILLGMTDDVFASSISEEKGLRFDPAIMADCIRERKLIRQDQASELKTLFYFPIQILDKTICSIVEMDTGLS